MKQCKHIIKLFGGILLFIIIAAFVFAGSITAVHGSQPVLHIEINGIPVVFTEAKPYIDENNRTMVPVLFVSEALGAEVTWVGETQTVLIRRGFDVIKLPMNRRDIWVNGETQLMDTQMVFNHEHNRNYVPLRFVSQNLGASISVTQLHGGMLINLTREEVTTPTGVDGISIGGPVNDVTGALGEPELVAPTPYGYNWWVYGRDLNTPYQLAGVQEGKVITFYTNSENWMYQGIGVGSGREEARRVLGYKTDNHFRLGPTQYQFNQRFSSTSSEYDFFVIDEKTLLTLYYDIHDNNNVTAARFTPLSLVPKLSYMTINWRYIEEFAPDHNLPVLTEDQQYAVDRGNEQILFDLANVIRMRVGLSELRWHQALSHVAYLHSLDMWQSGFFNHDSPNTGDPGDRLRAGNISYRLYLENIARGQSDAIDAHEGLMNSLGHRKAILNRQVTYLGTGVYQMHYTQMFLQ